MEDTGHERGMQRNGKEQAAQEQKWRYEDILYLPHPEPVTHPRMPLRDRAAQFAPFAALTGHGEAIDETRKQHEQRYTAGSSAQGSTHESI